MNTLRVGDVSWTLVDGSFGLGQSGEWNLTARMLDAAGAANGRLALFGYVTPIPTSWADLRGARITAAVEDPADALDIEVDGRPRYVAPFATSDSDGGAVLRVDDLTDTSITLSYAGPFLVMNDEEDPEDRPIDVELHITARRD